MTKFDEAIQRVASVVEKLARIEAYIKEFNPASSSINRLKARREILSDIRKEFEDAQATLEALDSKTEESRAAHRSSRTSFENKYFDIVADIMDIIESSVPQTNTLSEPAASNITRDIPLKLPTINLGTFSGNYKDWINFENGFKSVIHDNQNLSDKQRLQYLKSCLSNEALRAIEPLSIEDANYAKAWEILTRRFKNTRLIVQDYIMSILNYPNINKPSYSALRELVNTVITNIAALKTLNIPVDSWDALIVPVILEKLDFATKREWQASLDSEVPTFEDFIKFLEKRCTVLESVGSMPNFKTSPQPSNNPIQKGTPVNNKRTLTLAAVNPNSVLCSYCNSKHYIQQCNEFLNLSVESRNEKVRHMKLCLNCLRNNHEAASCRNKSKCHFCRKKHHPLLHTDEQPEPQGEKPVTLNNHSLYEKPVSENVLLATAVILIKNYRGEYKKCRVFLDCGSMSNCITRSMCTKLGLKMQRDNFEIKGLNGTTSTATNSVFVDIKSNYNAYAVNKLKCIVVDNITKQLPLTAINPAVLNIPENVKLADPQFYERADVELLLGAGIFWSLLCVGQIPLPNGLMLQKTQFGFVASGPYFNTNCRKNPISSPTICNFALTADAHESRLESQVSKFWELENSGIEVSDNQRFSAEEMECENHFRTHSSRDVSGRFVVKLPLKNNELNIGDSKQLATKRFYNLEKKFSKNPELRLEYSNFMREYLDLNHMKQIEDVPDKRAVYLPHHAVIKNSSTTTRLRVVFDASAKTANGYSLNDNLMCGPTIQRDLFSIVLEFRTFNYALNADITKMYRQILVHPNDNNLQLILWREKPQEVLRTYALLTLTYGAKPASFISTRCLQELADINSKQYPHASKMIKNNFYMDDLLIGANSLADLIKVRDDIIQILSQGQFELRKFHSNDIRALPANETVQFNFNVQLNKDEQTKILGLIWNSGQDTLNYCIDVNNLPKRVTKRMILSVTSQIFDPLGLVGPVIMKAKVILQQLWSLKLAWDEAVPLTIHSSWLQMINQLKELQNIKIPRKIISWWESQVIELHAFCDASQAGYGAALYLRTLDENGAYQTRLICAKSRVAPIKTVTLPRLELCGALLLARLVTKVKNNISVNISNQYFWTDSGIVLAWINTSPNLLKTFVSNRISEIISLTAPEHWRHIRSENNAADILSRGAYPNDLIKNSMWFNGPEFLKEAENNWPRSSINVPQIPLLEMRTADTICHANTDTEPSFLNNYSNFSKLQRITGWILRFVKNCIGPNKVQNSYLSSEELKHSTQTIVRLVQVSEFAREISLLKNEKELPENYSKLIQLNPFLDDCNILRVGGRLRNATIANDVKYPMLLPKHHFVTKLIIRHVHEQQLHAGPQATLAVLRQNYWIISARDVIRQVLHFCQKCFRINPIAAKIKMGDLPEHRVKPSRPFSSTGIDYAGPVYVRETRGRGKKLNKAYIALFICFATKAIHIELVADLTTQEFLGALRRFISRRGHPQNLYSDNGTNFIGAKNELNNLFKFLQKNQTQDKIQNDLASVGIDWHFIPPKSPHMGGLWEANIKSIKTHLKKIIGNTHLTFSEMNTLLVRIEACLNSRPLTPLTTNPNDLTVLTPFHFLIGETLNTFPEKNYEELPINRLSRWQLIERIRSHFWKRWSREYLTSLQIRNKWYKETSSVGDLKGLMVLLIEDNTPPLLWKIGRIIDTHPGSDGGVRVVTIQTQQGLTKRSLRKVCPLPIEP